MQPLSTARFLDRATPPHVLTLVLTAGVAALSLNIFLPSLPSMAAHFGVDYAVMQLSVSLYLAMTAVLQIFIGPVADRYGRSRRPWRVSSRVWQKTRPKRTSRHGFAEHC